MYVCTMCTCASLILTPPLPQVAQAQALGLAAALGDIKSHGVTFLVGGRTAQTGGAGTAGAGAGAERGGFLSCGSLLADPAGLARVLPLQLKALFAEIPEDSFRIDLSSTLLRQQAKAEAEAEAEAERRLS